MLNYIKKCSFLHITLTNGMTEIAKKMILEMNEIKLKDLWIVCLKMQI
jgi:hypothetical protein